MEGNKITLNSIKSGRNKKLFFGGLIILIAIPITIALVAQYQNNRQDVLGANKVINVVEKVGKIVELPANETPSIATVSDVNKLSGQEFFSKAQNGDVVLIYPKAQKAYLYRPTTDKLIEVAFYTAPIATPTRGAVKPAENVPVAPTGISLRDMLKTSPTPTQPSVSISPQVTSVPTPTP